MCGIAGVVGKPDTEVCHLGKNMINALHHRGPDGEGFWSEPGCFMGHKRLSIIGIDNGKQPFISEDGNIVCIANGEIYNHKELKKRYQLDLSSDSDCAVIIPLYKRLGIKFIDSLIGMFAIAIYDKRDQKLFIMRDRAGEKPLYYCEQDNFFLFASELTALSNALPQLTLDHDSLLEFFRFQYVPEPATMFKEIRKLRAGHFLEYNCNTSDIRELEYWNILLAHHQEIFSPPSSEKIPDQIRKAFTEAVDYCSISEAPIAVSLSGGLDSSAILACLAKSSSSPKPEAISLGYEGNVITDETRKAADLCQILSVHHHTYTASLEEMTSLFPSVCTARDDPIGDISGINYYLIARECQKLGIKVLLQGHGADELCWGYEWVRKAAINSMSEGDHPGFWKRLKGSLHKTPSFKLFEEQPFAKYAIDHVNVFSNLKLERNKSISGFNYESDGQRPDLFITSQMFSKYLRENGLSQTDRLGMRFSVESRQPFVNHKFVELIIRLRNSDPDHQLPVKKHLKSALSTLLPETVLTRAKQGFTPPVSEIQKIIFRQHEKDVRTGFLLSQNLVGEYHIDRLLKKKVRSGVEDTFLRLIYTLELWFKPWTGKVII